MTHVIVGAVPNVSSGRDLVIAFARTPREDCSVNLLRWVWPVLGGEPRLGRGARK